METQMAQKMQDLQQILPEIATADLHRFAQLLAARAGWELFRMNPIALAEAHGFDPYDLTRLFIGGTKVGLFEMHLHMLCPQCGSLEHSYGSLNQMEIQDVHCTLCDVTVEAEWDKMVEVSFSIHPSVCELGINPFTTYEEYGRYFFSANFVRPQELEAFVFQQSARGFAVVRPGAAVTFEAFDVAPGQRYHLVSLDKHTLFQLVVTGETAVEESVVEIEVSDSGFSATAVMLPAGRVQVRVRSTATQDAGLMLFLKDKAKFEQILATAETQPHFKPYLSGKMLLNNQKFRESFLIENLPNDLNLKISDLTVLFTDLKGSTELYERTGDVQAYKLVQEHFNRLTSIVAQHRGATVKTMGDAIMASFSTPEDGVRAAVEMLHALYGNDALQLKIGLHRGPALAVKANETLDFFGQTVNIAARVQSKAEAGEVWLSDAVWQEPTVQTLLQEQGLAASEQLVTLKGVSTPSVVWRCVVEEMKVLGGVAHAAGVGVQAH